MITRILAALALVSALIGVLNERSDPDNLAVRRKYRAASSTDSDLEVGDQTTPPAFGLSQRVQSSAATAQQWIPMNSGSRPSSFASSV